MAEQTTEPYQPESETWASGIAQFGAVIMILVGAYQALTGIVALVRGEFFVASPNYVFQLNTTTWGWIHIILGIIVLAAGVGVITGQLWGRVVGITIATLTMLANFAFIPYYPIWSLLIITLNVFVIWALCVYDRDTAAAVSR